MSTPLTDGINALTQYANEITGKQDATLSDAVGSLVEGYGGGRNIWSTKIASLANHFSYVIFDEKQDVVIDCSGVSFVDTYGFAKMPPMDNMFYNARHLKSLTLTGIDSSLNNSITFNSFASKDGNYGAFSENLESVSMQNCIITPSVSYLAFSGRTKLKNIDIVFDLSQIAPYSNGYNFRQMFQGCASLEEIRFVPNTILWMNYQIFNVSQVLSDASLISIANGLYEGATQYNSVTLLSTPKARCSTLMGNNIDGLFVADPSGTLTLADFITTVKGWTLA